MKLYNIFKISKKQIQAHGGEGVIWFARIFGDNQSPLPIDSSLNFIDVATLEPGSSVGLHKHENTTEVYLIVKGHGEYLLEGKWMTVQAGDVLINHCGFHSLRNNSSSELTIYVIEAVVKILH